MDSFTAFLKAIAPPISILEDDDPWHTPSFQRWFKPHSNTYALELMNIPSGQGSWSRLGDLQSKYLNMYKSYVSLLEDAKVKELEHDVLNDNGKRAKYNPPPNKEADLSVKSGPKMRRLQFAGPKLL